MLSENQSFYSYDYIVNTYDTDADRLMKLSVIFKLHQEVGERHLREIGMPFDYLADVLNVFFVLSKTAVRIYRRASVGEKITVSTFCEKLHGAYYIRCYRLSVGNEILSEAKSYVPVLDTVARRLIRPSSIKEFNKFTYRTEPNFSDIEPEKLRISGKKSKTEERKVYFTDCDYNHHLNNTVYADFAADCIPECFDKAMLHEVQIAFQHEAPLNTVLSLSVFEDNKLCFVEGRFDDKICFTARFSF